MLIPDRKMFVKVKITHYFSHIATFSLNVIIWCLTFVHPRNISADFSRGNSKSYTDEKLYRLGLL